MPQKPIYRRAPLIAVRHCFPAAGTFRTGDKRIKRLYLKANTYIDKPCMWEGLFRIACLIKNKPEDEPVAAFIDRACINTGSGEFPGNFTDQIYTARALFAMFEYNADRTILGRIAEWLRYIEIEFDSLNCHSSVLFNPADMMELLVRFYLVSGVKSALRLCIRLRANAFDWTTALHTFQQTIPIRTSGNEESGYCLPTSSPGEIDYSEKEKLVNHAGMLADGVRYTLYSGMFSGHGQDLSSGKNVWSYLLKHHHALCGGTTGNPFLSGTAADQPISNVVLCAWTEAFAAQMTAADCSWATEEMIRIVFNGIDDCLNHDVIPYTQKINSVKDEESPPTDLSGLYARMTRAVAAVYSHAVSMNESGFRINYIIPANYIIMSHNNPLIIRMDGNSAILRCKTPVSSNTELFIPQISTSSIGIFRKNRSLSRFMYDDRMGSSCIIHTDTVWLDQDRIEYIPEKQIFSENVHHQGLSFLYCNRLLCLPAKENDYSVAVSEKPAIAGDSFKAVTLQAENWKMKNNQPADIPVLPETKGEQAVRELVYYSSCHTRITMFPRSR